MTTVASDNAELIRSYLAQLSGKPKTEEMINQFVSDERLIEHIRRTESVAPNYELIPDQLVSEGNTVALRGKVRGTHLGDFNGIPPTGKRFSVDVAVFYRIDNGKIVDHWMVVDNLAAIQQLKG